MSTMGDLLLATVNAFDLKAAFLARHAQHPVIVHFPIALFLASAVFEILAVWRKQPALAAVAYFNLLGAAISIPFTIATGLAAWRLQLEGATLKGNLQLHLLFALTSAAVILTLCWKRYRLHASQRQPGAGYFVVLALGLMMMTVTGHLGGIVSGVETP
jgi:uncharacterized membrane protein